jgi:F-type H+-transporting ATPase subunit gamma
MAVGKEIRGKIQSVQNTQKITKAMEMVAASKMRKAQERMRAARPYSEKIRTIAANLSRANPEYVHPYQRKNPQANTIGFIVVTSDKGLCGGLNTQLLRQVLQKIREAQSAGHHCEMVAIGQKGLAFLNRLRPNGQQAGDVRVVAQATQLGDVVHLDRLIGPVKTLLDAYEKGQLQTLYLCYNRFVNAIKQEVVVEPLLPLSAEHFAPAAAESVSPPTTLGTAEATSPAVTAEQPKTYGWDYIYEPNAAVVIDALMQRYAESLVYQAVLENVACEQSARRVAMKAASDNAGNVIYELRLVYNKTRQAAITKELSEIVAGAAAV